MPDYIVKRGLLHDGEPYPPGSLVALPEDQASPLLRIGALEPAPEPSTELGQEAEAAPEAEASPPPKKTGPKPKPESAA